jgi:aminobenzoyl-glutamate utilization protein B
MYTKADIINIINSKSKKLEKLATDIWNNPELAFDEYKSVGFLKSALADEGFKISENLAGIDTAFSASFGKGGPVIGILGEFDALSGLSQEEGAIVHKPIKLGGNGHGCGHHLLGSASVAAAIAVKDYLEKTKTGGTVIYFGCPGEEGGSGKAFMARDGVFDGLDMALTWHPSDLNTVASGSSLANVQVKYKFYGIASHAAATPHLGRSALDRVELMNVGVNFLREHVIPEARMHYAVTNTGGFSPNVVQPYADVLYLLRAPLNSQVREIYERVNKIAKGAALMTETKLEIDFYKACSNIIPNFTLEKLMYDEMCSIPVPKYTEPEINFAKEIQAVIENRASTVEKVINKSKNKEIKEKLKPYKNNALADFIVPYSPDEEASPGSSDVGDVSWICPTAQVGTACYALDTPGHSWQLVSQGLKGPAFKGMEYAGKIMAATAIHCIENPDIIAKAKAEHKERVGSGYVCPIPEGAKPRKMGEK